MKKFTTEEITDLYGQVTLGKISFSRMAKVINQRMNETSEPQYKDGDFVVNVCGVVIIFKNKDESYIYDHAYFSELGGVISFSNLPTLSPIERYANEEEKQKMLDALTKKGKRWNEEKKCIEDIPIKLKNGDFVVGFGCVFILHSQTGKHSAQYHVLYAKTNGNLYYYRSNTQLGNIQKLRLATEEEKQELLDALAKKGKRWNAEELCIENIQVHKFKFGDKVRIKHGVSSKTHDSIRPYFAYSMDELIGKVLKVEYCDNSEIVICDGYAFLKEWLEPYEGLKKGDLAIFWDNCKKHSKIGIYKGRDSRYIDHDNSRWVNAIKFISKEQFEEHIKD